MEGDTNSEDKNLYEILFPDVSIIPKGGAGEVIETVNGLRSSHDHHHVEAYGLIDRDDRTSEQVCKLAKDGVFALDVCSVESLYYCSDAIEAVARRQAGTFKCDADGMAESAKNAALEAMTQGTTTEDMAARLCERKIYEKFRFQMPVWESLKENTENTLVLKADSPYPQELSLIQKLVANKNINEIIARYPVKHSAIPEKIAQALELRKPTYKQALLGLVQQPCENAILQPLADIPAKAGIQTLGQGYAWQN